MNELFSPSTLASHVLYGKIFRTCMKLNPIRSVALQAQGGGGGSETRMLKLISFQLIEMKLCVSHYSYKSILDVKFEVGSSSSFGDMTSQNFPWNKGTSHQIRLFTSGKRV